MLVIRQAAPLRGESAIQENKVECVCCFFSMLNILNRLFSCVFMLQDMILQIRTNQTQFKINKRQKFH